MPTTSALPGLMTKVSRYDSQTFYNLVAEIDRVDESLVLSALSPLQSEGKSEQHLMNEEDIESDAKEGGMSMVFAAMVM